MFVCSHRDMSLTGVCTVYVEFERFVSVEFYMCVYILQYEMGVSC